MMRAVLRKESSWPNCKGKARGSFRLGKPYATKICFCLVFFKRGGVMSETKLFEVLLCFEIFQEEGGGCLIPKFLRNFSA